MEYDEKITPAEECLCRHKHRQQPDEPELHLQPQAPALPAPAVMPGHASQSKQKQHLRPVPALSPLTPPVCLQQGLQQDWPTKFGKVIPPHIQELHIRTYLQKRCHGSADP